MGSCRAALPQSHADDRVQRRTGQSVALPARASAGVQEGRRAPRQQRRAWTPRAVAVECLFGSRRQPMRSEGYPQPTTTRPSCKGPPASAISASPRPPSGESRIRSDFGASIAVAFAGQKPRRLGGGKHVSNDHQSHHPADRGRDRKTTSSFRPTGRCCRILTRSIRARSCAFRRCPEDDFSGAGAGAGFAWAGWPTSSE